MTEERPPGGLRLHELEFGTLNNFGDTSARGSGSPRRGSSKFFLNTSLRDTFGRDTMKGVTQFNGIIISVRSSIDAAYARKDHLLVKMGVEDPKVTEYFIYKVYIPEIECRPYPLSLDDPVVYTYPDVYPSSKFSEPIEIGTVVKVQYSSLATLTDPFIVSVEGDIYFAFEGLDQSKLKTLWKRVPKAVLGFAAATPFEGPTPEADRIRATLNLLGPRFREQKKNGRGELSSGGDMSSEMSKAVIAVMKTLKNNTPAHFRYILTGGNDLFHHGLLCNDDGVRTSGEDGDCYTSRHTQGKAVDFTLSPHGAPALNRVTEVLLAYSAGDNNFRFIDEYTNPTSASTGGHFHMSWGLSETREGPKNIATANRRSKLDKEDADYLEPILIA